MPHSAQKPIIYIEDDEDDQLLIQSAINDLKMNHPILFFTQAEQALSYLKTTANKPLLILCDMNLPKITGLELRQTIDNDEALRKKAIPFIFFSTEASQEQIDQAYQSAIQGFFFKASSYETLKNQFELIIRYWEACVHPKAVTR